MLIKLTNKKNSYKNVFSSVSFASCMNSKKILLLGWRQFKDECVSPYFRL